MTRAPLSVLHIIPELPVGGAETLVFQMVAGLDRARFEPAVCVLGAPGPLGREMEAAGIEVVALRQFEARPRLPRLLPALVRLLRERRVQIVHTHLYHANYYGRLAAILARVPVRVASVHNVYDRVKRHRRWINGWLGRGTHAVLAGSERVRQDILRWDGVAPCRVEVMPYGIDCDPYRSLPDGAQARAALELPAGLPVVGTVGRLEAQKAQDVLLRAFAEVRRDGIDARLLIVGDGRERESLTRLAAELGVQGAVRLAGTRRDLPTVFAALDVFALPSRWEGTPLALMAAMAAGLPVIATPVGGVPDVVRDGETGRLVPADDAGALAAALRDALRDPAGRRRLGAAAREFALARCSRSAMLNELQGLYERLWKMQVRNEEP
jgi:glycosyltransferase involved in cell wall biosynthesis